MNILYDEDGGFKVGTVLQEQGGAMQVEAPHGKRSKVKSSHVLIQFNAPAAGELMPAAERLMQEMDLDFLWECAPQEEFDFMAMGQEYFGQKPDPVQSAALLMKLHSAPVYFHRKGRGRYRPAPPDILKAALAAVEKKRLQALAQQAITDQLLAGQCPQGFERLAPVLLARPDKNSMEYKALAAAVESSGLTAARLLLNCGAFRNEAHVLRAQFEAVQFPKGTGFPSVQVPAAQEWPMAAAPAFSIDDSTTTEIDDAFSVQWLPGARARIGIHIAAPSLLIQRGDAIDQIARDRLSTVYMPGDKITMLPDAVVQHATLDAGRAMPAVSLYVEVDALSGQIQGDPVSAIETVRIASNLRHNVLDDVVTQDTLTQMADTLNQWAFEQEAQSVFARTDWPFDHALELALLWRVSKTLTAKREAVRGKPEKNHHIDYNFYVENDRVQIVRRRRDAPLDVMVAEFMILANETWGGLLHDKGIPGIYRAQAPMGRVRMTTHAAPHAGLGVAQYAWSTSPLRRYVDLVNQWQIVSVLTQAEPVFAPKDADLYATLSAFDATYKAYADFQSSMERYWCLRWIEQEALTRIEAVVVREDVVRMQDIPLVVRLPGLPVHPRGTRLSLDILGMDKLTLDIELRLHEVLADAADGQVLDDLEDGLESEDTVEGEAGVSDADAGADHTASDSAAQEPPTESAIEHPTADPRPD